MKIYLLVHAASVFVSFIGFTMRGIWMLRSPERLKQKWVKVTPHIVDTLLILSAIGLVLATQQYPLEHNWLAAKLVGLVLYIALGMVAFRFGKTLSIKVLAWLSALLVYVYIVSVAITKNALIFIA